MGQSLWAGVDAGKADHYCVVIDADEQRLELPLKSWRVRLTGALIDAADDGPRGWKSTHPTNPTRSPTPSNARDSLGW